MRDWLRAEAEAPVSSWVFWTLRSSLSSQPVLQKQRPELPIIALPWRMGNSSPLSPLLFSPFSPFLAPSSVPPDTNHAFSDSDGGNVFLLLHERCQAAKQFLHAAWARLSLSTNQMVAVTKTRFPGFQGAPPNPLPRAPLLYLLHFPGARSLGLLPISRGVAFPVVGSFISPSAV